MISGRELPPGETGEICVCGLGGVSRATTTTPRPTRRHSATAGSAPAISATWTSRASCYITGRASDMYISGGSNVYPRETEEKMLTHPAIAEVAIVGVPDRTWGEVGVAVVALQPGAALGERELLAWMEGKVARYKLPKRVFFWDELPKSGYGKITKKIVREELEARGCLPLDEAAGR